MQTVTLREITGEMLPRATSLNDLQSCNDGRPKPRPITILSRCFQRTGAEPVAVERHDSRPVVSIDFQLVAKYVRRPGSVVTSPPQRQTVTIPVAAVQRCPNEVLMKRATSLTLNSIAKKDYERAKTATVAIAAGCSSQQPQLPFSICRQVLEYLYVGGVNCARNGSLLCHLNIAYMINLSGMDDARIGPQAPCLCPVTKLHHSRYCISIDMCEKMPLDTILDCFVQVNKCISEARQKGKRILIYSEDGHCRAPVIVMQFLMSYYKMKRYQAHEFISKSCRTLCVTSKYEEALAQWERLLETQNLASPLSTKSISVASRRADSAKPDRRSLPAQGNRWT